MVKGHQASTGAAGTQQVPPAPYRPWGRGHTGTTLRQRGDECQRWIAVTAQTSQGQPHAALSSTTCHCPRAPSHGTALSPAESSTKGRRRDADDLAADVRAELCTSLPWQWSEDHNTHFLARRQPLPLHPRPLHPRECSHGTAGFACCSLILGFLTLQVPPSEAKPSDLCCSFLHRMLCRSGADD